MCSHPDPEFLICKMGVITMAISEIIIIVK